MKAFPQLHFGRGPPWPADTSAGSRSFVGPDIPSHELGVLACPAVDDARRWTEPVDAGWLSRGIDYGYNWYTNVPQPDLNEPCYRARTFRGQRGWRAAAGEKSS